MEQMWTRKTILSPIAFEKIIRIKTWLLQFIQIPGTFMAFLVFRQCIILIHWVFLKTFMEVVSSKLLASHEWIWSLCHFEIQMSLWKAFNCLIARQKVFLFIFLCVLVSSITIQSLCDECSGQCQLCELSNDIKRCNLKNFVTLVNSWHWNFKFTWNSSIQSDIAISMQKNSIFNGIHISFQWLNLFSIFIPASLLIPFQDFSRGYHVKSQEENVAEWNFVCWFIVSNEKSRK